MLNKEMTKEIVTVKDLAKYLHCHQSTIYRLVKRGEIPGFRLGGGWRFKIDEIDRWCRRAAGGSQRRPCPARSLTLHRRGSVMSLQVRPLPAGV